MPELPNLYGKEAAGQWKELKEVIASTFGVGCFWTLARAC